MKNQYGTFLYLFFLISVSEGSAQWTDDTSINTLVSDSAFYKEYPSFIPDGSGGYFVVWSESHGFPQYSDVYAQHVDADGYMLWGAGGVLVGDQPWSQIYCVVTRDNSGGIYMAWMDNRDSNNGSDEYKPAIARLDSDGNILWSFLLQEDADLIITIPSFPINILSDGAGGVFVSWTTYTALQSTNIMMQRLDESGTFLWGTNLTVTPVSLNQIESQLVRDGEGGCYVGWTDERDGRADFYVQHVDVNGSTLWTANGEPILTESDNSNFGYRFISDGEQGAYIAYARRIGSSAESDIYAQRIDPEGEKLWGENGVSVCSATDVQTELEATLDDNGQLLVVWEDHRETQNNLVDIYAQKVSSDGVMLWSADGVLALDGEFGSVNTAAIVPDGQSGAIVSGINVNLSGDNTDQVQLSHISAVGSMNGEYQFATSSTSDNKLGNRLLPVAQGQSISLWGEDRFDETHRLYLQKTTFELNNVLSDWSQETGWHVWPNPCADVLNITANSNLGVIRIFDTLGNAVMEFQGTSALDISSLPVGLYCVRSGEVQTCFVKK